MDAENPRCSSPSPRDKLTGRCLRAGSPHRGVKSRRATVALDNTTRAIANRVRMSAWTLHPCSQIQNYHLYERRNCEPLSIVNRNKFSYSIMTLKEASLLFVFKNKLVNGFMTDHFFYSRRKHPLI